MLYFSPLKKAFMALVCLIGFYFAMPNFFYQTVDTANKANFDITTALNEGKTPDEELVAAATAWPSWAPSGIVNLGLDLQGGAHFLYEVQIEQVYAERMEGMWPDVRDVLRSQKDIIGRFKQDRSDPTVVGVRLLKPSDEAKQAAVAAIETLARPVGGHAFSAEGIIANNIIATSDDTDIIKVSFSEEEKREITNRTMAQSLEIIRRRVDELGTREPTIQRQGERRILVQLPGASNVEIPVEGGKLSFHMVDQSVSQQDIAAGRTKGLLVLPDAENPNIFYALEHKAPVTGENLTDAQAAFDQDNGRPIINFRLDTNGARKFGEVTRKNVGKAFAIVLDKKVVSAPTIQSHIPGGSGQISGQFTVTEAQTFALLLRSGALPADITIEESSQVGPELGADSVAAGKLACIVAFLIVMIYMFLSYGLFGFLANIALIINVMLIFAALSTLGATLTLPGIAGIVLTIGMAVDANVLIFERIREELRGKRNPARSIEIGYERAFSAIIDANVTTFIAAVILFAMGTGPVKGFSVTLGIGIITSVFTAVMLTRFFVSLWYGWRQPKELSL